MTTWAGFVQGQLDGGAAAAAGLGRPCVGCYGDRGAECRALASGPALVDRSYRGLLEVRGADRAAWLHNLTTNMVKTLAAGEGNYAFALNLQGRILFDLNVIVRRESIWVDLDGRFLDRARKHFDRYIITEDVAVADRSGEFVRFGLAGDGAKALLADLGAPHAVTMPSYGMTEIAWGELTIPVVRHDFCGPFTVELFVPAARAVEVWKTLSDPSRPRPAIPAGEEAVQIRRIEAGLPWPFHEITDEYLPAETRQLQRAVDFNKGCYLGQEVVERMRSRSVVARQLVGLRIDGDTVPLTGAVLIADGDKTVGQLTSACHSLAEDAVIALGYVKTPVSAVGTSLRVSWEDQSSAAVVA